MKKVSSVEWLVRLTILLLLFLCCYLLIKLAPLWQPLLSAFFAVLTPFLVATLFTYLLMPLVEALHRRKVPRPLAIALIYVIFFGALGFGIVKGVPYLIDQLKALMKQIPEFVKLYKQGVNEFYYQTSDLPETVHDHFRGVLHSAQVYADHVIENVIKGLKGLARSFLTILTVPVLVFYFLNDYDRIRKTTAAIVPNKWHRAGKTILSDIDETLGGYIRGQIFVCFCLAVIAAFGLWILGIPYFVLFGIIIGVTDIIPYFGPILGAAPVAFVAATISWQMLLYVLGLIIVLHFLEGNFLSPLIVGRSLHMHPVMIILALLVGEQVGGLLGLLIAVPAFAVIRVLFIHFRERIFTREIDKT
ncbi:MAG TPA: AI-2E family transporter [Bacillales bacterium]|nr:AI-2E family transporter [Bacillales bacterium]